MGNGTEFGFQSEVLTMLIYLFGILGDLLAGMLAGALVNSAIHLFRVEAPVQASKRRVMFIYRGIALALAIGLFVLRFQGFIPSFPHPIVSLVIFMGSWFILGDKLFQQRVLPWLERQIDRLRW